MAYTAQDITNITKIVGCDYSFYNQQSNTTDPYYESTMYLVNNGITINDEPNSYTDLYYGARKLSDTLIVNNYPDDPAYPDNKIYLQPTYSQGGTLYGYKVYFKSNGVVIPLATTDQLILVNEVEDNPSVLEMTMTINGEQITANVLCINPDGTLPSDIYSSLYNQLKGELSTELSKVLTWQPITGTNTRTSGLTPQVEPPAPTDYNQLTNKPKINGITLQGNLTGDDLDLVGYVVEDLGGLSI